MRAGCTSKKRNEHMKLKLPKKKYFAKIKLTYWHVQPVRLYSSIRHVLFPYHSTQDHWRRYVVRVILYQMLGYLPNLHCRYVAHFFAVVPAFVAMLYSHALQSVWYSVQETVPRHKELLNMVPQNKHFEADPEATIVEVVDGVEVGQDSAVVRICSHIHKPVCYPNVWADVWECPELCYPIYYSLLQSYPKGEFV